MKKLVNQIKLTFKYGNKVQKNSDEKIILLFQKSYAVEKKGATVKEVK